MCLRALFWPRLPKPSFHAPSRGDRVTCRQPAKSRPGDVLSSLAWPTPLLRVPHVGVSAIAGDTLDGRPAAAARWHTVQRAESAR